MRRVLLLLIALVSCSFAARAQARAPDTFEEDYHEPIIIESPQWFGFELRVGPYAPALRSRDSFFDGDRGWLLNLELDITLYKIPYVGQLNLGLSWGWSKYDANTIQADGTRAGETFEFVIFPMAPLAVLRVDALARHTVVPLVFAGKLGYEWVRWKAETEGARDFDGVNKGLRWGLQAGFELDFFNRESARRLDEDYGINHTYLLFEYIDSNTRATGDRTYTFGLGAQF